MLKFFAVKMWVAFAVQKLLTFFQQKNIRILCIESAKTVNEMALNELVKLTMLWTTGSRKLRLNETILSPFRTIVSTHRDNRPISAVSALIYFYFPWDDWAHSGTLQTILLPYKESQGNRNTFFNVFFVSKAIFFRVYSTDFDRTTCVVILCI